MPASPTLYDIYSSTPAYARPPSHGSLPPYSLDDPYAGHRTHHTYPSRHSDRTHPADRTHPTDHPLRTLRTLPAARTRTRPATPAVVTARHHIGPHLHDTNTYTNGYPEWLLRAPRPPRPASLVSGFSVVSISTAASTVSPPRGVQVPVNAMPDNVFVAVARWCTTSTASLNSSVTALVNANGNTTNTTANAANTNYTMPGTNRTSILSDLPEYAAATAPLTRPQVMWVWGWVCPPCWFVGCLLNKTPIPTPDADPEKAQQIREAVDLVRAAETRYARRCAWALLGFTVIVVGTVVLGLSLYYVRREDE